MKSGAGSASELISLPKGGGALHGMGEKFSPDLHTGTGNFTVPIALPSIATRFYGDPELESELAAYNRSQDGTSLGRTTEIEIHPLRELVDDSKSVEQQKGLLDARSESVMGILVPGISYSDNQSVPVPQPEIEIYRLPR